MCARVKGSLIAGDRSLTSAERAGRAGRGRGPRGALRSPPPHTHPPTHARERWCLASAREARSLLFARPLEVGFHPGRSPTLPLVGLGRFCSTLHGDEEGVGGAEGGATGPVTGARFPLQKRAGARVPHSPFFRRPPARFPPRPAASRHPGGRDQVSMRPLLGRSGRVWGGRRACGRVEG